MKPHRALGLFLLCFAGGATAAQTLDPSGSILQWAAIVISGVIVPVLLSFRKEAREALHQLRSDITTARLDIARLEAATKERDRVTRELLDRKLVNE